jgi:hypothetical protein
MGNEMKPTCISTETLGDLYRSIKTTSTCGMRSHLRNASLSTYSWGKSFTAGTYNGMTDQFNGNVPNKTGFGARDSIQSNFKIRQEVQKTQFTPAGLGYAAGAYGHGTKKYHG